MSAIAKKPASKKARASQSASAPSARTFILRTCKADMTSHNGFRWPTSGPVTCPDWKPRASCGNGLHGLLMGVGDGSLLNWAEDAKWLVVAVDAVSVVAIDDAKVKVPAGDVVYCGTREGAIAFLMEQGADPTKLVCGQASASGDRGQASASGYRGQASASGDGGRAMAGTLGLVMLSRWDEKAERVRVHVGYVGEDGIEANTWYRLDGAGAFVTAPDDDYPAFTAPDCAANARAAGAAA